MNITKENINDLNAILKINITKADYEENYEKALREQRKKAQMHGFRSGMVPINLIKKMYGNSILLKEINKLISDSITAYFKETNLKIIGDPLPHIENNEIDFENDTEFNFKFDLGLYPEFELKINKKEKYNYYDITIDDNLLNEEIKYFCNYYGELKEIDEITDEDIVVEGDVQELDSDGNILEDGIKAESVKIFIKVIKDEDTKKRFLEAKKFDLIKFNAKTAFPNDTDRAGLLNISKEKAIENNSDFQISINVIKKFQQAELNQALYDKAFGEGIISSDEHFKEKIIETLKKRFKLDFDLKFKIDTKIQLKINSGIELPTEFLKRWIRTVNKDLTEEQIENEFSMVVEDLKWQIIKEKILAENKFDVTEEEIKKEAIGITRYQYEQQGFNNISDVYIEQLAEPILKNEKTRPKIIDKIIEDKIFEHIKENVKLETKEVTLEEFREMFKH